MLTSISPLQLPTAEIWLRTADRLYGMFMLDQDDTRAAARPHFNTLNSLLDINHRFSEGSVSMKKYDKCCIGLFRFYSLITVRTPVVDVWVKKKSEKKLTDWLVSWCVFLTWPLSFLEDKKYQQQCSSYMKISVLFVKIVLLLINFTLIPGDVGKCYRWLKRRIKKAFLSTTRKPITLKRYR